MWRLGLIILGTLVLAAFIWFSFYVWGFSRPIFKYDNEFLSESKVFVKTKVVDKEAQASDGIFILVESQEGILHCNGEPCLQFISQLSSQPLLIQLNLNKTDIHTQFMNVFESFKSRKDIGFISRYPNVVISVKELVPGWSFGSSEVEQSKVKVFEALGLIHLPDLKGDFWVTSLGGGKQKFMTEKIVTEMKRRGRALVIDQIHNQEEADLAIGLGADAVVIEGQLRYRLKSKL